MYPFFSDKSSSPNRTPALPELDIEVLDSAESVARTAATMIAVEARAAEVARGRFVMALSGGHTPWLMLRALAMTDMPWHAVHVVQVDERAVPAEHPERNFTHIRDSLLRTVPMHREQIHAMPVESDDLECAATLYGATLRKIAGSPPVLDLVHLGMGADGHTASLIPQDPVLRYVYSDVAVTGEYRGRRRMTLTYPIINRSRQILFVVTGGEKAMMLSRLMDGDDTIPAGRVRREGTVVIADRAAARYITAQAA